MATHNILKNYKEYNMFFERRLNYYSQKWEEQINSRNINIREGKECRRTKRCWDNCIEWHGGRLKVAFDSTELEVNKREFKLLFEELEQFQAEMNVNFENFRIFFDRHNNQILRRLYNKEQQRLSAQRIQQFLQFQADESLLGDQCVICMGDIEVGRNMMRLDCDGQHTFCQVCIEGWFAIKKTCPICRHVF